MPQISSEIVITKTVSAGFGNEKDGMCLVFIKNKVFVWWGLFLFLFLLDIFFSSRFNQKFSFHTQNTHTHVRAPEYVAIKKTNQTNRKQK